MLDEDFLTEFGLKLKMYRIKRGMTQAQLGEAVEISEHRISEIECGKCNITLKTVNKLANAISTEVVKLFNFD